MPCAELPQVALTKGRKLRLIEVVVGGRGSSRTRSCVGLRRLRGGRPERLGDLCVAALAGRQQASSASSALRRRRHLRCDGPHGSRWHRPTPARQRPPGPANANTPRCKPAHEHPILHLGLAIYDQFPNDRGNTDRTDIGLDRRRIRRPEAAAPRRGASGSDRVHHQFRRGITLVGSVASSVARAMGAQPCVNSRRWVVSPGTASAAERERGARRRPREQRRARRWQIGWFGPSEAIITDAPSRREQPRPCRVAQRNQVVKAASCIVGPQQLVGVRAAPTSTSSLTRRR